MTKKKQQAIVPHQGEEIKLTPKQRKFLWHYFRSGNGVQSALKAYDTKDPATAGVIASQNLAKLKDPIRIYMEKNGLSLGKLVEVLNSGLEADKVVSAVKPNKDAGASETDFLEIPDHRVRHLYMTSAAKWLGVESKGPEVEISKSQFNFFSISKEKRAEFNKKFNDFVRSEAFTGEVVEAKVVKGKEV